MGKKNPQSCFVLEVDQSAVFPGRNTSVAGGENVENLKENVKNISSSTLSELTKTLKMSTIAT